MRGFSNRKRRRCRGAPAAEPIEVTTSHENRLRWPQLNLRARRAALFVAFLTPPAFAAWSLLGPSADAQLSIANSAPEDLAPPQAAPRQVTTYSAVASPTQAQPGDYQVYPLRHAQANDVDEALVRMLEDFGTRAEVIADSRNNRILIRGNPQTVKMAGQLLETLDRPAAPPPAPRPYLKSYRIPAEELADGQRFGRGGHLGNLILPRGLQRKEFFLNSSIQNEEVCFPKE